MQFTMAAHLCRPRAASFNKPILVIKAGVNAESRALTSRLPTEKMGSDSVYDAVFRRAGMLRVGDLRELLAAVETLANSKPIYSEQLWLLPMATAPVLLWR